MACERAKRKQFNWYELEKYEGRDMNYQDFLAEIKFARAEVIAKAVRIFLERNVDLWVIAQSTALGIDEIQNLQHERELKGY